MVVAFISQCYQALFSADVYHCGGRVNQQSWLDSANDGRLKACQDRKVDLGTAQITGHDVYGNVSNVEGLGGEGVDV